MYLEKEQHQDGERATRRVAVGAAPARHRCAPRPARRQAMAVPAADLRQDDHRRRARPRENQAMLRWPHGSTMNAASSGPVRRAGVAADLEQRLREPVPPAGRHARHARGFGVKDRRADADQRHGDENHAVGRRDGEQQQADQREAHAGRQRIRLRPRSVNRPITGCSSEACLVGERDEPDLPEVERVRVFRIG